MSEQETVIRWGADENIAHIYTCYQPDRNRCVKQGFKLVRTEMIDGKEVGWFFEADVRCISFRKIKEKRQYTPEQLEVIKARFAKARESKQS